LEWAPADVFDTERPSKQNEKNEDEDVLDNEEQQASGQNAKISKHEK
jgi:hypothetical protein